MHRNESHLQCCRFPLSLSNCTERSEQEPESIRQKSLPTARLRFISFCYPPSTEGMGDACLRYAGQTAPAALPGCAGLPGLRRCSIAADTAGLGMLQPRAPRASRGGDAEQPPGRTSPNRPAGAPRRSPPASRCLRRTGVNTAAAPPSDRCPPAAAEAGRSAAGGGHRAAPSPGPR